MVLRYHHYHHFLVIIVIFVVIVVVSNSNSQIHIFFSKVLRYNYENATMPSP